MLTLLCVFESLCHFLVIFDHFWGHFRSLLVILGPWVVTCGPGGLRGVFLVISGSILGDVLGSFFVGFLLFFCVFFLRGQKRVFLRFWVIFERFFGVILMTFPRALKLVIFDAPSMRNHRF